MNRRVAVPDDTIKQPSYRYTLTKWSHLKVIQNGNNYKRLHFSFLLVYVNVREKLSIL